MEKSDNDTIIVSSQDVTTGNENGITNHDNTCFFLVTIIQIITIYVFLVIIFQILKIYTVKIALQ